MARPRATILGAVVEGWRRVLRAPAVTFGVFVLTAIAALPLAIVVSAAMVDQLGSSALAERVANGWDPVWASEFASRAAGIERTVTREMLGFGGAIASASRLLDGGAVTPALAGAIAVYLGVWIFLGGGIVDRFARARPMSASAFFGACGMFAARVLRLSIFAGACYWAVFRWVHPWLFETLFARWTHGVTEERDILVIRAGLYVAFILALMLINVVSDFARVRLIVEDRRSVISAIGAGARFIRRRPWRVAGLYLLNVVVALVIIRLWLQLAPGATAPTWLVLMVGQLVLVVRLWARLAFMASEVVFFQGELAHGRYTAAPESVWPDSAAVEAIRNLRSDA